MTKKYRATFGWRDETGDVLSIQQSGPGVSRNATENTVDFTTASNLSDFLYLNVQLNHDRQLTTAISPHVHFQQALNAAPNFLVQYRWQINGAATTTAWTNLACNALAFTYVSGTLNQIADSANVAAPASDGVSDIIQVRLLRDNANASGVFAGSDPYAATVRVVSFDIHIQIDASGSASEYAK